MRTVRFIVELQLDLGHVEQTARLRGRDVARVHEEMLADLDCRLHDAVRHRDSVVHVSVRTIGTPGLRLV